MFFRSLETRRLVLRNIARKDSAFIFKQFSTADVNQYLFDAEPLQEMQEALDMVEFYMQPEPRDHHRWILERRQDGVPLGTCGFHCWDRDTRTVELGYDLAKAYWGQGYMGEAIQALLDFAREDMGVKCIHAHIYIQNQPSIVLVEKKGFVVTGERYEHFRGKDYLHHIYSWHAK